jgi:hypothetical protein
MEGFQNRIYMFIEQFVLQICENSGGRPTYTEKIIICFCKPGPYLLLLRKHWLNITNNIG